IRRPFQCMHLSIDRYSERRDLHSSPTRRSSDLPMNKSLRSTVFAATLCTLAAGVSAAPATEANAYLQSCLPLDTVKTLTGLPLRSEEHTSELQSRENLVCRLLLEKKNPNTGSQV